MHFWLCIIYSSSLSLWELIGKFRFLKIDKGEGQNFLVYFDLNTNHVSFWFGEEKMKPVKLDMLHGFFIYLFIYLATSLFYCCYATFRNTQSCERNYREKA